MQCKQRLYLTKNGKKLVPQNHKDAATLYAVPGDEIPQSAAERFGLVDGALKGFKEDKRASDKEQKGGRDKTAELTDIKGIGPALAKALVAAGVADVAALAEVDPATPPTIEKLPPAFDWNAVVGAAKELAPASETEA